MSETEKDSVSTVEETIRQLDSAVATLLVDELDRVLPPEQCDNDHTENAATIDALRANKSVELKPLQHRGDIESPPQMLRRFLTQLQPGFIAHRSILRKFASLAAVECISIVIAIGACVFLLYKVVSDGNSSTAAIENGPIILVSIGVIFLFSLLALTLHFARLVRN